jgi:hypothetical protein
LASSYWRVDVFRREVAEILDKELSGLTK